MHDLKSGQGIESKKSSLDMRRSVGEAILERVSVIQRRLGEISDRLNGETPEAASDNQDCCAVSGGILGQIEETQQATLRRLDCADEWLGHLENTI